MSHFVFSVCPILWHHHFAHQGPAPVGEPWVRLSMRSSRISPPGLWDFVPGFCVARAAASSSSSVLAAPKDGLLTALPSRGAADRWGLACCRTGARPHLHRQRRVVGLCSWCAPPHAFPISLPSTEEWPILRWDRPHPEGAAGTAGRSSLSRALPTVVMNDSACPPSQQQPGTDVSPPAPER